MRRKSSVLSSTVLLFAAVLGGCGNNSGSANVSGTVKNQSLVAADAIAYLTSQFSNPNDRGTGKTVLVTLSSVGGLCSEFVSGSRTNTGETTLLLSLMQFGSGGVLDQVTATSGTYSVRQSSTGTGSQEVTAVFLHSDSACGVSTESAAGAGTVTITAMSPTPGGSVTGTFDLTFDADHIAGSFSAGFCAGQEAAVTGTSCDGGTP